MEHLTRFISAGLATSMLLAATTLGASAQGLPGTCTLASDAVVAQALGPSAHSMGGMSRPGADMCAISADGKNIVVQHMPNFQGDDPRATLSPAPAGDADAEPTGGGSRAATPIDGLGDSAILLTQVKADEQTTEYNLMVRRGTDLYTFAAKDLPDAPVKLVALAGAVLAGQ